MKRILWGLLILVSLVVSGCGAGGKINDADTDTGGTSTAVAAIDLSASKLTLNTNGTDTITFNVFAKTAQNAAASAATISVVSTGGTLLASSLTTDANGKATFTLGVGTEKANRQISVTLTAGNVKRSQTITISGTTLTLTASKSVTTPADVSPIVLTATLRDAASQPISNATISFTSAISNTFAPSAGYTFTTGSSGKTDDAGLFKVTYVGTNITDPDPDIVTVASSGAKKDVSLTTNAVSKAFFGFTVPADPSSPVAVSTLMKKLEVQWLDTNGNPKKDEILTFFATKGYFGDVNTTTITADTDASGLATLTDIYNTGTTAGPATITVYDSTTTQTAELILDVRATTPTSINLQLTPGVIPVTTVNKTSTAILKATVRDINNQAVAGKVVGFSIFTGTGGGEFISPVTAITDSGGIATSTFTSGSSSSGQDGVELRATVAGVASPATAKMTIAQSAATVSIGTTNKINKIGETGYVQEFTVLVTDSSGGAVEGAVVSLSLVPIRFYTGVAEDLFTGVFLSEDVNRNYILDADEICPQQLDPSTRLPVIPARYWQGGSADQPSIIVGSDPPCISNGRLDPGAVASIDSTVTTSANGMGVFNVYYPKSFGRWVEVELTATTDVTGTNASDKIDYFLNVMKDDDPYLSSPFGF